MKSIKLELVEIIGSKFLIILLIIASSKDNKTLRVVEKLHDKHIISSGKSLHIFSTDVAFLL